MTDDTKNDQAHVCDHDLTERQRRFVEFVMIEPTMTKAALKAGYSQASASQAACRLMDDPRIQKAVAVERALRSERTRITADQVLRELSYLAFIDVRDLANLKNVEDLSNLPEDVTRGIVGWCYDPTGRVICRVDKLRALVLLAKHLGVLDGTRASPGNSLEDLVGSSYECVD